ncbi:hypothetical protein BN8_03696 [Fibrisoma limi BUZ 3]|uniref:DUF4468 domain-containing protein n=1 Tax=Fibrisoma limi BUZ 3 TaxID=1185876 RepID=I2GKU1_9BACT|nr:DUF4468 domain-containing protein [Fibrisoma limi]CCH54517.1 hypothetical protein BN8_03696 [Fibrisoma limi BUZ 3]
MKKLTLLFLLGVCFCSCSTKLRPVKVIDGKLMGVLPLKDGKVTYIVTETVNNASDLELFRQTRRWAAFRVASPSDVFKLGDAVTKDVIGSGYFNGIFLNKGSYAGPLGNYVVTVECNQGAYRATLSNFRIDHLITKTGVNNQVSGYAIEAGTQLYNDKLVVEYFKAIDRNVQSLLASLKEFVNENAATNIPSAQR